MRINERLANISHKFTEQKKWVTFFGIGVFDNDCFQSVPYIFQTEVVQENVIRKRVVTVQVNMIKIGEHGEEAPLNVYTLFDPGNFDQMRAILGVHRGATPFEIYRDALLALYPNIDITGEYPNVIGGEMNTTFSLTQDQATAISKTFENPPSQV